MNETPVDQMRRQIEDIKFRSYVRTGLFFIQFYLAGIFTLLAFILKEVKS